MTKQQQCQEPERQESRRQFTPALKYQVPREARHPVLKCRECDNLFEEVAGQLELDMRPV